MRRTLRNNDGVSDRHAFGITAFDIGLPATGRRDRYTTGDKNPCSFSDVMVFRGIGVNY